MDPLSLASLAANDCERPTFSMRFLTVIALEIGNNNFAAVGQSKRRAPQRCYEFPGGAEMKEPKSYRYLPSPRT